MNTLFQKTSLAWLLTPVLLCAIAGSVLAQDKVPARPGHAPLHFAEWLKFCLQAWQERKCDGVVTYCLEKEPGSRTFDLARDLFNQYRATR
jgi:hypothetical protein